MYSYVTAMYDSTLSLSVNGGCGRRPPCQLTGRRADIYRILYSGGAAGFSLASPNTLLFAIHARSLHVVRSYLYPVSVPDKDGRQHSSCRQTV